MKFTELIRIRYNECDMQGVVFNANYWMYADDVVAQWMRKAFAREKGTTDDVSFADHGFDFMCKTVNGTWYKPATYGSTLHAACNVTRWGNTSFDVAVSMLVKDEVVFDCVITYVSTRPGAAEAVPVPDFVKDALEKEF